MMNSKDLLARLLANENLNVIRANVSTASFESVTRTLTLPQWKDMSVDQEEMLIGHEVGHALFTTIEHVEKPDFRTIHGYMNVVEDVRIEKKIKNMYPGLRKAFITGYKQLNEKDFFGVQGQDLSKLLLIDRINLYYKCGFNCGVKFTPAEMELVRRTDQCDTMDDVYNLAREIYAFSKEDREAKQKELEKLRESNGEDLEDLEEIEFDNFMDDPDDFDNDYAEEVEQEDNENSNNRTTQSTPDADTDTPEKEQEELESKTQRVFNDRLSELADTTTVVQYFIPKLETSRDVIIDFKRVLSELKPEKMKKYQRTYDYHGQKVGDDYVASDAASLLKFKTESMRVVNYLVKEFEMRKSATEYKRITTSKSGDLDVRKLYAHTLTDDIFKKLDVVPEDKNHGMIFLLDWSGSMCDVMHDTIKQVINLAMFCQRIQIPYQVFAFTSGYDSVSWEHRYSDNAKVDPMMGGFSDSSFHLIEFFNNKMSNTEFNQMVDLFYNQPYNYHRSYSLNSTPLNESLVYLVDYIGKFVKNNSVEKMSLITLTDGEGHSLQAGGERNIRTSRYNNAYEKQKVKNYVRDPITKKEYSLDDNGSNQTRVFLRIIKDRYNIKTIGFHVVQNSRRSIDGFIRHNIPDMHNGHYLMVEQLRKEIRQNDYALVENTGRDELYLLPASKQKIEEGDLIIDSKDNAKNIAKQFGKFLGVKKSSRVVLSRFVGLVA